MRNTDTRRLKRTADGYYTNKRLGDLGKDNDTLCGYCGQNPCPMLMGLGTKVQMTVEACKEFLPIISFSVTSGLEEPIFNTVRLGKAWPKRLNEGDRVRMMNSKEGQFLRIMRVQKMETGLLGDILASHAHRNHALIASDAPDKPAKLLRILRGAYGSTYTHAERTATAIYLEDEWHYQSTSRRKASRQGE